MYQLLGMDIFESIKVIFLGMGSIAIGVIQFLIFGLFWLIFTGIAIITHFCEVAFKKLAGIDVIYLKGNAYYGASGDGQDLVYAFISDSSVQDVFWSILGLSLVLLFVFTIVALIKSEFTLELKASAKGPIIARGLKSLVNFMVVPVVTIISIIGTNYLTKTIYDMFGGEDASIVSKCFVLGGYNANRARKDEKFYSQLKSGNFADGYPIFSGGSNPFSSCGSQEEMANLIDKYFIAHKETDLKYKDYDMLDMLKNYQDGKATYLNEMALILGNPRDGEFYYTKVSAVNFYYNLADYDYILGVGSMIVMAWTLFSVALVLLKRIFELTILFLLSPVPMAIAPLDGGQAEKKWRQEFMKRLLATVGPIFAINMYFLLIPLFMNISLFNSLGDAWATATDLSIGGVMLGVGEASKFLLQFVNIFDMFFQIVCILTGLSIMKSASAILSNLLGIDDLIKSSGENMKKAVDLGQKAFGVSTAIGGVAFKGAAFALRSGVGAVRSMGNREGRLLKKEQKAKDKLEKAKESGASEEKIAKLQGKYDKRVSKTQKHEANWRLSDDQLQAGEDAKSSFFSEKSDLKSELDEKKAMLVRAPKGGELAKKLQSEVNALQGKYDDEYGGDDYSKTKQLARTAGDKASGADAIHTKAERIGTGVRGIFSSISRAYDNEYGENSKDNNLLGKIAGKANDLAEKTHIPILSTRLKKHTKALSEYFNVSGDVATRRLNDMLGNLFGDGGGQQLWKINFNGNARAALYEGLPESKAREQGIQQGLLMGARKKYETKEAESKLKEEEMKNLARYFAEQNNDPKYKKAVEDRRKAEMDGDKQKVAKLDKEIARMNAANGYNRMARENMSAISGTKGYKDFKERVKEEAYADEAAKERRDKAFTKEMAAKYGDQSDKPQRVQRTEEDLAKETEALKKALEAAKTKTTLDSSVMDALAELFVRGGDSIAKSIEVAIQNALNELNIKK